MISPEALIAESQPGFEQVSQQLGVPVNFNYLSPQTRDDFTRLDSGFIVNQESLTQSRLPEATRVLFEDNDALAEILNSQGKAGADVSALDVWQIQAGQKAYIMLWRATTSAGNGYFVTYIGREPSGSQAAKETHTDFNNLRNLRIAREALLRPDYKERFDVVNPITKGTSGPTKAGTKYDFYVTPFIRDYAELAFDLMQLPGGINLPYFRHAYNLSTRMEDASRAQYELGPGSVIKAMTQAIKKIEPGLDRLNGSNTITDIISGSSMLNSVIEAMGKSPGYKRIIGQQSQLLIGLGLIYWLSDQRMPAEFMVNAGDFMTRFDNNGSMFLLLDTVRGGYTPKINPAAWVDRMKGQLEPIRIRDTEHYGQAPVFYNIEPQGIAEHLQVARTLLK